VTLLIEKPAIAIVTQGKKIVTLSRKAKREDVGEAKVDAATPAANDVVEEIADSVKAFHETDFGDTAVKRSENEKKAFDKLAKKFERRKINLTFSIERVTSYQAGKYALHLGNPSAAGSNLTHPLQHLIVALAKAQSLKISSLSILEICGSVKLVRNGELWSEEQSLLAGAKARLPVSMIGDVTLLVEQPTVRIVTRDVDGRINTSIMAKPVPVRKSR